MRVPFLIACGLLIAGAVCHGDAPEADTSGSFSPSHGSAWIYMNSFTQSALPESQLKSSPDGNVVNVVTLGPVPAPPNPGPRPCPTPRPRRIWMPGYYTWTTQSVWVPGPWEQQYFPPVYETQWYDGQPTYVMVQDGYWQWVQLAGHYEQQSVQIWVPGRWVVSYRR